jgi:competence protein ComEA
MNKTWWWAGFIVVGILLGAGILMMVTRPPRGEPVALLPPPTPAPITVFVSGAVKNPGLYQLQVGSRLNDAINAAGGFSAEANSSGLNLAKILQDGDQVNVPIMNTSPLPDTGSPSKNTNTLLVDINSSTLEQLDTLPEIGEKTAQVIIDYRNANGPFTRIEDILDVLDWPGDLRCIKDLITVGMAVP